MEECIVVFDSGLGGVTALLEALKAMPSEHFLYYGDTNHVPYGPKPKEAIRSYMDEVMEQVAPFHPKAILLACNTATVASADYLREKYTLPIIGMEPAVKPALKKDMDQKRILVLSTEATGRSDRLRQLVERFDDDQLVDILPLPNLVDFAERLEFNTDDVRWDLETILSSYDMDHYGAVVLGCTHFIWYRDLFRDMLPDHVDILDGNAATVRQLIRKLDGNIRLKGEGSLMLTFSGGSNKKTSDFLKNILPIPFEELSLYGNCEQ